MSMLQLGHGILTMDTNEKIAEYKSNEYASIGPWHINHGYTLPLTFMVAFPISFNWAMAY